jgi:hypothetical protein
MTRCAARGALIFGFTLLAGCAPDADREAVPVDGGPGAVEEVAETSARDRAGVPELPGETARERCKAFYEEGLAVAARTRSELREELGEPGAIEGETEPNRHDPARMDSLWTVRYDGLAAEIRTAGGNDLLERMTVTDSRHLRYREPAIGTTEDAVTAILGDPDREADGDPQYLCAPEPMPDMPITFRIAGGRVAVVVWEYYVD